MGAIFVHVAVRDSNNCEVIKGLTSVGGSTIHLVAMLSVSNYIAIFFKMAALNQFRSSCCFSLFSLHLRGRIALSIVDISAASCRREQGIV